MTTKVTANLIEQGNAFTFVGSYSATNVASIDLLNVFDTKTDVYQFNLSIPNTYVSGFSKSVYLRFGNAPNTFLSSGYNWINLGTDDAAANSFLTQYFGGQSGIALHDSDNRANWPVWIFNPGKAKPKFVRTKTAGDDTSTTNGKCHYQFYSHLNDTNIYDSARLYFGNGNMDINIDVFKFVSP